MNPPPEWLTEKDELKIFRQTVRKMERRELTIDAEMVGAYAHCLVQQHACAKRGELEKARIWRGGVLYARNRLGIFKPIFVDFLDVLIDENDAGIINVTEHLDPAWQIERPESYMTDPTPY